MSLFIWVVFAHFVGDFALQSHWMASNKSRRPEALLAHVAVYTATLAMVLLGLKWLYRGENHVVPYLPTVAVFATITFVLHASTDALTSRLSGSLFRQALAAHGDRDYETMGEHLHNFFLVIGFDQLLHYLTLWLTLHWLKMI